MELKKLLEQEALENLRRDSAACREVVQRDLVEVVRCNKCEDQQNCRLAQRLGWDGFCSEGHRRVDHE